MSAVSSALIVGSLRGDEVLVRRLLASVADRAALATELVQEALYHGVLPLVGSALASAVPGSPTAGALTAELPAQLAHVLRLEAMAVQAVTTLAEAGIACAVFKGPALSHGYYRSPAERLYGDVDLLVSPADFVAAGEVLAGAGLRRSGDPLEAVMTRGYGEAAFGNSHGQAVDLHWHLMREAAVRSAFSVQTEEILSRASKFRLDGHDLPGLAPEDELLAVATHACFDGGYRLGWLVDLARIAGSPSLDWAVLAERADRTGTALPVQVMLDRAQRAIGLNPEKQLLHYSTWRTALAGWERIRPAARTFRQAGRGGLLFRATRTSTLPSTKALLALAFAEGLVPLVTDRQHRWRRPPAFRQ